MERSGNSYYDRLEQILLRVSQAIALLGGGVLVVLTLVTVYSIVGRTIARGVPDLALLAWWRPIRGDFELIEMGTAVAIFSFLPYTQMIRGNVLVDFFTARASRRVKAALAVPANLLFTALAIVISWRMTVATLEQYLAPFTQTTMLLRLPLWWGYVPSTLFTFVLAAVCLFCVLRSAREALGAGEPVGS